MRTQFFVTHLAEVVNQTVGVAYVYYYSLAIMYFGTNSHLFMRIRRRASSPVNVFQRNIVESVESLGGVTAGEPWNGLRNNINT